VGSHIKFTGIEFPNIKVLLVHPEGGVRMMDREEFDRLVDRQGQIPFKGDKKFNLRDCLQIHMYRSNHPEQTISYRFVEGPTGKVFVFVTDHENQDGLPKRFQEHFRGADLLVMDCQYTETKYRTQTAGWGHATPNYVARVAVASQTERLGITHHDPPSSDDLVKEIVKNAKDETLRIQADRDIEVFGCHDYMKLAV
jgi:ribonuclease BN (tRNA processing enzyme)